MVILVTKFDHKTLMPSTPLLYELGDLKKSFNIDICELVGKQYFQKENMKLKSFKTTKRFNVS